MGELIQLARIQRVFRLLQLLGAVAGRHYSYQCHCIRLSFACSCVFVPVVVLPCLARIWPLSPISSFRNHMPRCLQPSGSCRCTPAGVACRACSRPFLVWNTRHQTSPFLAFSLHVVHFVICCCWSTHSFGGGRQVDGSACLAHPVSCSAGQCNCV